MGDPLDGMVIGQFLFRLGLGLGRRGGVAPLACSNLLQQFSSGQALHQVAFDSRGVVRLLEFRRSARPSIAEYRKFRVLQAALRRQAALRQLSRRLHWYVEPTLRDDQGDTASTFDFSAGPYLDGPAADGPRFGLDEMIERIVDEVLDPRAGDDGGLIADYLFAVAQFAGRAGAASGLLIVVDASHGIRWAGLGDVSQLRDSPEQLLRRARRDPPGRRPAPDPSLTDPTEREGALWLH